jgi:hypothetical protein
LARIAKVWVSNFNRNANMHICRWIFIEILVDFLADPLSPLDNAQSIFLAERFFAYGLLKSA